VVEHSQTLVDEAMDNVVWRLDLGDHGIRVWRSIMVDQDWLDGVASQRPLGVCWAFDKDVAECHWGDFSDGKREIRIEGVVDPADVDWASTLRLNAKMDEEKEIRILDTAFVTVVSAEWIGVRHAGDRDTVGADIATGLFPAGDVAFRASGLHLVAA
jgi:hypothetical protein